MNRLPMSVRAVVLGTLLALAAGCALVTQPSTPARVLQHGVAVLDAIGVAQTAVIAAHDAGLLPTDQAVVAMRAIGGALERAIVLVPLLREAEALTATARDSKLQDALAVIRLLVTDLSGLVVDDATAAARLTDALHAADVVARVIEGRD
jgi:hypothetical protein